MKRHFGLSIFVAYGGLIAYLSLTPDPGAQVGSFDKVAHLAAYGVFAIIAAGLGLTRAMYFSVCAAIIVYSGLLEIGQSFVPGREMSLLDLVANAAGVALGAALCVAQVSSRSQRTESS